jgi:hypothetical protein
MKRITAIVAGAAAMAAVVSAPITLARAGRTSSVKIVNHSQWTIERLYLSPVDEQSWGPDQLESEVIDPGETYTLHSIPCDSWDVKLVDEDGDECIVPDVDLCKSREVWEITSKDLLKCQAASEDD